MGTKLSDGQQRTPFLNKEKNICWVVALGCFGFSQVLQTLLGDIILA